MGGLTLGASWLALVLVLLARILAYARAHAVGEVRPAPARPDMPSVTVIVPARNEGENIGPCLLALAAQDYPKRRLAIVAVDDGSNDGTASEIARLASRDGRIRTVAAGALRPGWLGKPNACWCGAEGAGSDWLCFIDADVRAEPALIASAVLAAEARGVDLLSLHPAQELGSLSERLVIPAGMLIVAATQTPVRAGAEVAANGQFLLIRRRAYEAVGGHGAVRAEVCEDTALARCVAEAGYDVRVLPAERLARTRMYRDLPSLWEGFAKNAVDILGSNARTVLAAIGAVAVAWGAVAIPPSLLAAAWWRPEPAAVGGAGLAVLGSAVLFGLFWGALRHFRIPSALTALLPAGFTVVAALACYSVWLRWRGRVRWKGRVYEVRRQPSATA